MKDISEGLGGAGSKQLDMFYPPQEYLDTNACSTAHTVDRKFGFTKIST